MQTIDKIDLQRLLSSGEDIQLKGFFLEAFDLAEILSDVARGSVVLPRGVRIFDARVRGDFNLEAFNLRTPVSMRSCIFEGTVVLRHTVIKSLIIDGSVFLECIDARDVVIEGQIVARNCAFMRPVLLRDATISGQANFLGSRLLFAGDAVHNWIEEQSWGHAISFARSTLGSLKWMDITIHEKSVIDLTDATVGSFHCDLTSADVKSWPSKNNLHLNGFRPARIDRSEITDIVRWLDLSPDNAPSAYRNLGVALENEGLHRSKEMLDARAKRNEVRQLRSISKRCFYKLIFGVTRYGEQPIRAVFIALFFFIIALIISYDSRDNYRAYPKSSDLLKEECYYSRLACGKNAINWKKIPIDRGKVTRNIPKDYPDFRPFSYTVDKFIPFIGKDQTEFWRISPWYLDTVQQVLGALAIFFSSIYLGTITGLISVKR